MLPCNISSFNSCQVCSVACCVAGLVDAFVGSVGSTAATCSHSEGAAAITINPLGSKHMDVTYFGRLGGSGNGSLVHSSRRSNIHAAAVGPEQL